ncbi:MAG: hypothetical protein JWQ63_3799 [Mucilaginibacter sp.]|nr:hypothetical protein [Mucilaginibacter sp.]
MLCISRKSRQIIGKFEDVLIENTKKEIKLI